MTVGADPKYMLPGYEDAFYYMWKERRLPSNVTPETSNLKDKLTVKDSAPDDELSLCAYEAWGEDCVNHLIGDFAFANAAGHPASKAECMALCPVLTSSRLIWIRFGCDVGMP